MYDVSFLALARSRPDNSRSQRTQPLNILLATCTLVFNLPLARRFTLSLLLPTIHPELFKSIEIDHGFLTRDNHLRSIVVDERDRYP